MSFITNPFSSSSSSFFSFFFFFFLCVCKTPSAPALISMKVLILLLFPARHSVTPTMATASVPVPADDKKCSVCHKLFTDPKLLPCSHLLCRHCLISWLQSKAEANCPLCRCVIVDPEERTGVKNLEDIGTGPHFNVIYFRK